MKHIRIARGLTQAEAAEMVGVKQAAWSKWEVGTTVPTAENMQRIKEVFELESVRARHDEWLDRLDDSNLHIYEKALMRELMRRYQKEIIIFGILRISEELDIPAPEVEKTVKDAEECGLVEIEGRENDVVVLRVRLD